MPARLAGSATSRITSSRVVPWVLACALLAYVVAPLVVAWAGSRLAPLPGGLRARYYTLSGEPITTVDHGLIAWLRGSSVSEFRVAWEGWLVVEHGGTHRFWTHATGPALLWVDGRLVVDNGGRHPRQVRSGEVGLTPGVHPIRIDYTHEATPRFLHVAWVLPTSEIRWLETPIPELQPDRPGWIRRVGLSWRRNAAVIATRAYAILALGLVVGLVPILLLRRVQRRCGYPVPPALWLGLSLAWILLAWFIDWGLPARWTRAPDELLPVHDVLAGLAMGFSGGWSSTYPPLHFYILSPMAAVLPLVTSLGLADTYSLDMIATVHEAMRVVSVALTLGTMVVAYWLAVELSGPRRTILAPLVFVLSMQVLYYAKVTNVDMPATFWLSLSLLFFVRLLRRVTTADAVWLGCTAAAAIATKDMTGGFYVLMPAALVAREYVTRRTAGQTWPFLRATCDRRYVAGALAGVLMLGVLFNPLLNWSGVSDHLETILQLTYFARPDPLGDFEVPPVQENDWRYFPRQTGLQLLTPLASYAGWPGVAVVVLGLAWAVVRRERRVLLWLLVPALSYYVCILVPLGKGDDRYLLGVWLIACLFGGALLGDLARRRRGTLPVGRVLVVALVTYAALWGNTTNILLRHDTRLAAERFIEREVSPFHYIGLIGILEYLPRVDEYTSIPLDPSVDDIRAHDPTHLVMNVDHMSRYARHPANASLAHDLLSGALGYVPIFDERSTLPWWALGRTAPAFRDGSGSRLTNLDQPMSRIVILERRTPHPNLAGLPATSAGPG